LLWKFSFQVISYGNTTPLHEAVQKNDIKTTKKLLDEDAEDADAKNFNGYTPLQLAVENNNANLIQILLESGADVNQQSSNAYGHDTALSLATKRGYDDVARLLIINGASTNAECKEIPSNIRNALKAYKRLNLLYGPQNNVGGNKKTRVQEISKRLINFSSLPSELIQLVLDYDNCPLHLKSIGKVPSRNLEISEILTEFTALPKELIPLILHYDSSIFDLKTVIPSIEDLASAKIEIITCHACGDNNDVNTIELQCPSKHRVCWSCFKENNCSGYGQLCPECKEPIKNPKRVGRLITNNQESVKQVDKKKATLEVIDECPICRTEELTDENTKLLPCSPTHKICQKCFAHEKTTQCPICQQRIKYEKGSTNSNTAAGVNQNDGSLEKKQQIQSENKDYLQILVDYKDKIDNNGELWTPLHHAAQKGAKDLVSTLLEQGANMEAERDTQNQDTALGVAASNNRRECVRLLLLRGKCIRLLLLNGAPKRNTSYCKRAIRGLENVIEYTLIDRKKLLAFYGDPKLCGNVKTRNALITNWLTKYPMFPKELIKLILDYDICIFTLETIIPSDKDLALIKDKSNQ